MTHLRLVQFSVYFCSKKPRSHGGFLYLISNHSTRAGYPRYKTSDFQDLRFRTTNLLIYIYTCILKYKIQRAAYIEHWQLAGSQAKGELSPKAHVLRKPTELSGTSLGVFGTSSFHAPRCLLELERHSN